MMTSWTGTTLSKIQRDTDSTKYHLMPVFQKLGVTSGALGLGQALFTPHVHYHCIHSPELFIIPCSQLSYNMTGKLCYKAIII